MLKIDGSEVYDNTGKTVAELEDLTVEQIKGLVKGDKKIRR